MSIFITMGMAKAQFSPQLVSRIFGDGVSKVPNLALRCVKMYAKWSTFRGELVKT